MATSLDRGAYGARGRSRAGRPIGWDRNQMAQFAGQRNAKGREISTSGGLKSLPGAPMSPLESMSTSGLGVDMGKTDKGAWDQFFTRRLPGAPSRMDGFYKQDNRDIDPGFTKYADGSEMDKMMSSFMPSTTPDAAPEMARAFIPPPASPVPTNPRQLISEAIDSSMQFFDRAGIPIDTPIPGRVQSGTQFASPYGGGSVRFVGDNADIYTPGTGEIRPRRRGNLSFLAT